MIIFNTSLATSLGLNAEALNSAEGAEVFAGNLIPEGAEPLAQAYAGHQFGNFNMLGDGRALLLGEQLTPQGERVDIQLKATVFSSIDTQGRYAYGNQPYIGGWNLARFAETLLPLLHEDEEQAVQIAQDAIAQFSELYHHHWLSGMRSKLGLFNEEAEDEALIRDLLELMEKHSADYTNTFLALTFDTTLKGSPLWEAPEFEQWKERYTARLGRQQEGKEESQQLMRNSNPAVIPRNHRVEEALEQAENHGDLSVMEKLLAVLSNPFAHAPEQAEYAELPAQCNTSYQTFCGT
ncbi:hypothetical protein G195_005157 [Phytophthora kernoviae 00238/432]|uniref:Selenoprotein O n=1 Tax=Phytophthora kernoviae 00238/432 TaxID=1284355 RepID=A0A8J4S9Z4_9STRA|nr:hypothetical protein G195_005157 [Phytophthora kernoviae 00238/432]